MAQNWLGTTAYYSCDFCFSQATIATKWADHCQQCAEAWDPFDSDAYFATLAFMDTIC